MNWEGVLDEIRSARFDASLNVVSSTNGFFQALAKHPTMREACIRMGESGMLQEETLGVIYELAEEDIDPQFESPNDTALAALLWLTAFASPANARAAATYVDRAPQCWYAKKLAQSILNPPRSPTTTLTYEFPHGQHRVPSWSPNAQEHIESSPIPSIAGPPIMCSTSNPYPLAPYMETTLRAVAPSA